jgi:uncharacterized spore protein YtfJ
MTLSEILEPITSRLQSTASVKSVFGEPITAGNRTIVPVARISVGFGGGIGQGSASPGEARGEGSGGGGGGGVQARPVGVVEISDFETRFIPIHDKRRLAAAAALGLIAGILIGKISR